MSNKTHTESSRENQSPSGKGYNTKKAKCHRRTETEGKQHQRLQDLNNMPLFNAPENFSFEKSSQWTAWKQDFARFQMANKLYKDSGDIQVSSVIYAIGK